MWWGFAGPDEFAFPVTFGKEAYEAWLSVEDAAYIGVGDARVAPGDVDGDAHLILVEMRGAVMEAHHACGGAPRDLV